MNAEFVDKIRQRSRRDLIHAARLGWVLYPLGILIGFFSKLWSLSPRLFWGFGLCFALLLALRLLFYRKVEDEQFHLVSFITRTVSASFLWGLMASYGVAHEAELPLYIFLHFGSLVIIGIGGLVMYVPVFWIFLLYLGSYGIAFTGVQLVVGGSGAWPVVMGNLAALLGLAWIGRRMNMAHSRALVSSLLLERRARELEAAYQKLEQTNAHRVQFMQSLSAELHSSLDGINRVSEFLKQTPLGDEQLRLVETSRRTTRDLVQYLEGVSEIASLESGKTEFYQDQIFLQRTLGGLLEELSQQALLGGRSFVYRLQPGLPEVVQSDRHRLQQLVRIMAENCMRLTDPGGTIRLHAEWSEAQDGRDMGFLLLRFTDTGVGIDTAQIRSLIEDAYLAQNDAESPLRGISLHFALLGRILFRMQGKFHVDSLGEAGNAYEITLPLKIISWRSLGGEELEARFDSLGLDEDDMPRILLVDDNVLHQKLVAKLCVAWGYSLEIASSGPQALQWIELRHFDLVLIDVLMPMLNCYEIIHILRQRGDSFHRRIAIVGLSCDIQGEGQRAAVAAGTDAFVAKPFAPDVLYQVISEQLNISINTHD